MRILLTSDLHYKLRQYDWVIGAASNFDATVIAGDHIDAFSPVPGIVQIAALSASFTAVSRASHLVLCSGNHDLNARNHAGEKTADWLDGLRTANVAVDGDTVTVADTLFTVCPWWDGPYARAEQKLESASRQRRGRWSGSITHHLKVRSVGPASATGDAVLAELVKRYSPTAVLMWAYTRSAV